MNIWEKSTPGRGHSKCKVLVAGAYFSCSKKGREASVAGWLEGQREEDGRGRERCSQGPGHRGPYGAWKELLTSFLVLWEPPEGFN